MERGEASNRHAGEIDQCDSKAEEGGRRERGLLARPDRFGSNPSQMRIKPKKLVHATFQPARSRRVNRLTA